MAVIVTAKLRVDDDFWATKEELKDLSDAEVLSLIGEDLTTFLHSAEWEVERNEDE